MKTRKIITILSLLIALSLAAYVLRTRGYLHSKPDIFSVSPNGQQIARLYQLKRTVDKNYRITVHNAASNTLIAEYFTPDEGVLDSSVKFVWNADSSAVILIGDVFFVLPTPRELACQPNAYLLIDTNAPTPSLWTAARQDPRQTPRLTNAILQQHHFCRDE